LTYRGWIDGLAAGRTVVSRNAHREFLDLKVNRNAAPGDEISLTEKGPVAVDVRWSVAEPFTGKIEVVRNGVVVASREASATPGQPASLQASVDLSESSWICARRVDAKGHQVHTGAVYVTIGHAPVRASSADADFFVRFIDNLLHQTSPGGAWSRFFPHERDAAQARYRRAKAIYERIAAEARTRAH
jgi:hypothetical protein